ncbi:forkhead box protein F1-like [Patiria miniata]|uniref:Fork-head domain-containing protein n=1 Tax=Patiria miniata TaxID=46514 RepID=A0A914AV21_PATMI|nr:forkhead box protein F1-like [Patiria miniata]
MISLKKFKKENGGHLLGNLVEDQSADHGRKPSTNHGDVRPRAPARRRLSTKGIRRPGYKRRVSAPYSYVELITMAIKASPHCMLTLREIVAYLEENNECFQGSYVGWKNSVRHNLSSSRCFVKLLRNSKRPFGKDNFWAMNPDCSHCHAAKPSWQCNSSVKIPRPSEPSLHQLAPSHPTIFYDQSTVPEPRWQSNGTPPEVQHVGGSTAPSPVFDDQPIESSPIVLPAGASVLPPTVHIDQPVEPASASSSKGDDTSVQLLPLDLSMHTSSTDKFHSPRKAAESSRSQPNPSPVSGLPEVSTPRNDVHYRTHHNLPISRFLNSPTDEETCKDNSSVCLHPESRVAVTDQSTMKHNTTNASSFSRVLPYVMRRPSSSNPDVYGFKSATLCPTAKSYTPWNLVPRDGVPRTPEEVRVFESLYDHYWNQALHEREALYHRQAKLRSWHQYPVVYATSDKLSGCTPISSVPNSCLGRPNSWPPMQCVPLEKHIV